MNTIKVRLEPDKGFSNLSVYLSELLVSNSGERRKRDIKSYSLCSSEVSIHQIKDLPNPKIDKILKPFMDETNTYGPLLSFNYLSIASDVTHEMILNSVLRFHIKSMSL